MYDQIVVKSGHLALGQISGLVFKYNLGQQTSSHECQSDTLQVKASNLKLQQLIELWVVAWSQLRGSNITLIFISNTMQSAVSHDVENNLWESYVDQIAMANVRWQCPSCYDALL